MKNLRHLILALSIIVSIPVYLQAQIVGSDAFLQGNYVEAGVNGCGAFASSTTPPAGYVSTGLFGLNFIADTGMDGWDSGDPNYCGDYAMPGSPVEGWGIEINGANYYNTDQGCYTSDIPGDIISYEADGDSIVVVWEGTVAGVTITQRSILFTDNLYFVTNVTLSNSSGADINDIYYRRNIDPDNEQLWSGSFTTINTVESNPILGDPFAIVTAIGETYGCYLAMVANNIFASASRGNFSTVSGVLVSDSYNGLSGFNQSGTLTEDGAIQMSFWVPSLTDGGTAEFAFAYVFAEDAIDDALSDTYITSDDAVDVGVIGFNAPASGCGLGEEEVTIKVFNFGYEAQSDIPVNFQVDGGTIYTGTILGPVAPATIATYTFSDLADLSATGDYSIVAWTEQPDDANTANDDGTIAISNIPVITAFPYMEDFEGGSGGWTSGGTSSTWELGYPDGPVISGPPPTTPSSENSWATGLYDYYSISEDSYVLGPCFDFSTLEEPYVKLDIWWDTPDFYDGARLEYSLDAGGSWQALGDIGTGDNWYTAGGCYAFGYDPVTYVYFPAWEGSSGGWKTAKHDLGILAGEPQVQLRVHFKTSTFFSGYDGIAFDNFFVGDPYPDDIGVTALVAPGSGPSLGATEAVTVTIENFGLNSESGFPVSYQMDGGTVHTETFIGSIAAGDEANFTFSSTEDLSADGDYAFVAWTELGTDGYLGNDTLEMVVSNLLPISGTDAYYIYSTIDGGYEPFYTTGGVDVMNTVFGEGEWTLGYFESVDADAVFSTATCFIWLEGGGYQATELNNFVTANSTAIQNWVASGGHLFINSMPYEGDAIDYGFGGISRTAPYSSYIYSATQGIDHPIYDGPFTPVGTYYSYAYSNAVITGDVDPILVNTYDESQVILGEKNWGAGVAMFGSLYTYVYWTIASEAENLHNNLISYLAICTLSDTDVGVQSITAPATGCGLGDEAVGVKVRNYGYEPQTDIPVNYTLDGVGPVTETIPGTLEPGETVIFYFTTLADISVLGTHDFVAWTSLDGDTIYSNDTSDKTINNIPIITSYPYLEDFEDGDGGWSQGGVSSTWELGYPDGPVISGPPPATPSSENSWVTSLTGYYNTYENSYVLGPCFDFGPLTLPYVQLDVWWATPDFWDGARLEYSLDAGTSWETIGGVGTGDNWYQPGGCYSFGYDPITYEYYPAWEGTGTGWVTAKHDISFLAGEPQVQFRVHFASSFYYGYDGFAFDNFKIADPYPDDIGVTAIIAPTSGASLTASESVTVMVENFGTITQSDFPVSFQLDGGSIITESFDGSIAAGEEAAFTFDATVDLSAEADYSLCAWTELEGDEDASNDMTCKAIAHLGPVTGSDAFYIYSNAYGGSEPWYTTSNSDAMNTVFGFGGWNLDYFETLDPGAVFTSSTCFVFLEGGDAMADELEAFLTTNLPLIEGWVSSGGHLFLNSAPNEGDGMSFGFDGTTLNYAYYTGTADAATDHPIFDGPYTPVGTEWTGGSFGHATVSGSDMLALIVDAYATDNIVLAEKSWGDGTAIFGGMTPNYFHSPIPEADNLRANIIAYLATCGAAEVCDLVPPTDIYADVLSATSATIHWTNPTGAESTKGTIWELSTGDYRKFTVYDVEEFNYPGDLTPATTYGVRLKTGCMYGEIWTPSDFSDWYYFTTDPLREGEFAQSVSVFPNPNDGNFRIQLNGYAQTEAQVFITNSIGQMVYSDARMLGSDVEVIDLSLKLAAGTYFVKVLSGSEILNQAIVIE